MQVSPRKHDGTPRRGASRLLLVTALAVFCVIISTPAAFAQFKSPTPLVLVNGWTDASFGTSHASVELQNNIVQFRGAINGGTSAIVATLAAGFAPETAVYIPVDICNAHKGRLFIQPNGVVQVQTETSFSDAQCFTSLDGASFALSPTGFSNLTLENGWTGAPFYTSNPAFKNVAGVVRFKGAMATSGTSNVPFTIPSGSRPSKDVYVEVDLCDAAQGRLHITPAGAVTVESESGFAAAQCFTSLDGVFYLLTPGGIRALTPIHGWTGGPFKTASPQAVNSFGLVLFKGAVATTGTNIVAFTLPTSFRPVTSVYLPVNLCDATKGRLLIQPNGNVTVIAESQFSDAQCFTSLDGVGFVQ